MATGSGDASSCRCSSVSSIMPSSFAWILPPFTVRSPPLARPTSPCTPFPKPLHCLFARCSALARTRPRMQYDPTNPLIVQGDRTVLVEVDNPRYAEARDALAPFAELEKSPEHIHTYRITPLSLWNAAAAGHTAAAMVEVLGRYSKFPLPTNLQTDIAELVERYGRVKVERFENKLRLV